MGKRLLATFLTICMVLTMVPKAKAATILESGDCGWEGNNVTYTLDSEGTLTISGSDSMANYDAVTSSTNHAPWYDSREKITTVIINDGVTEIGSGTFYDCTNLTKITIPNSVEGIAGGAFLNCSSLISITIPDSVTSIGDNTFKGCSSLPSITIPDRVISIGDAAFADCSSLTSITIPVGVTRIAGFAFSGCSSLTEITIPVGVNRIDGSAFEGCSSLTEIAIPGVTSIGERAFRDCSSLKKIIIPDGVTSIGDYTFYRCSGLTEITIPASVTSIGASAFDGCSSLTSITIPNDVTSIGSWAFAGCSSLASITIPNGVASIGHGTFQNCSSLTSITIPNNVTSIDARAFEGCSSLASITIPNGVTSIGDYAFQSCSSLTSITIPNSVTSIGVYAFSGCSKLTSITIPKDLASISNGTFQNCSSLTSITIPDSSITSIGGWAFDGCSGLTDITIPVGVTSIGGWAFSECSGLTQITIPDSVTSIGEYAFANCSKLTEMTIPVDVTSISNCTFSGCSGLTKITIPDGVSSIGGWAFYHCSSLTEITIPDDVTSIGGSTFNGCSSLAKITIPAGVTSIDRYAFDDCSSLTDIFYKDSLTTWRTITIETGNELLSEDKLRCAVKELSFTDGSTTSAATAQVGEAYAFPAISSPENTHWLVQEFEPESVTDPSWTGRFFAANESYTFEYSDPNAITLVSGQPTTIQFNSGGGTGTMADMTATAGQTITLPDCSFTYPGYAFAGWSVDGDDTTYTANSTYNVPDSATSPIIFTATWTANTITIQFNNGGGTGTMANMTASEGQIITLPVCSFTRPGYEFAGWSLNGTIHAANSAYTVPASATSPIIFTATWTAAPTVITIQFSNGGGTGTMANMTVSEGQIITLPVCSFTRPGYEFTGWSLNGSIYAAGAPYTVPASATSPITFTATWTATSTAITIQFSSGGGTGTMANMTASAGQTITLPACDFTRPGYEFGGWSLNGIPYAAGAVYTVPASATGAITFTATWTETAIVPPVTFAFSISAQSIPNGTENPTLTLSTNAQTPFDPVQASDISNYSVDPGTTGLTLSRIELTTSTLSRAAAVTEATLCFEGTANAGTMRIQAAPNVILSSDAYPVGSTEPIYITVPAAPTPTPSETPTPSPTPTPSETPAYPSNTVRRPSGDVTPSPQPDSVSTTPTPSQEPVEILPPPMIAPPTNITESPIQNVVKDDPNVDWIERIDPPDYALDLYQVLVNGSRREETDLPDLAKCLLDDDMFLVDPDALQESNLNSNVVLAEQVTFELIPLYAQQPSLSSMAFTDASFFQLDVSADDRKVDYANLKLGDVIKTPQFNGVFVTAVPRDNDFDDKKKEVTSYVGTVFHAFDRDHPEIFWLTGQCQVRILSVQQDGQTTAYFFLCLADAKGFSMRSEVWSAPGEVAKGIQRRDAAVKKILDNLTGNDTASKLQFLNRWLTEHNEYNTTPDLTTIGNEPHECLSALEGRTGTIGPVCEGYSRAFKVLCDQLDINCVLENGYAKTSADSKGSAHMWNSVQIGELWYGVDVTWNDPRVKGISRAKSGYENEDYFLVGSNTVIRNLKYSISHPATNQAAEGGVNFTNGPILNNVAYLSSLSVEDTANRSFSDVAANDWFADAVAFVSTHNIMNGVADGTFAPRGTTTRAMLVTMLYRLEGEPSATPADFSDVKPDFWYTNAIGWAAQNGIVSGYGNGSFGPDDTLTREQVATILYRYSNLKGYDTSSSNDLSSFSDATQISPYALEAMQWANAVGLMTGVSQNTLSPSGSAERAQIATIFMRFCDKVATDLV